MKTQKVCFRGPKPSKLGVEKMTSLTGFLCKRLGCNGQAYIVGKELFVSLYDSFSDITPAKVDELVNEFVNTRTHRTVTWMYNLRSSILEYVVDGSVWARLQVINKGQGNLVFSFGDGDIQLSSLTLACSLMTNWYRTQCNYEGELVFTNTLENLMYDFGLRQ